jgi:acyl carrier protein
MTEDATADIEAAHRLTPMQHLMLLHELAEPGSDACYVQYSLRVSGPFDPRRYLAAWQRATDRHTALRTCFAWRGLDEPLQVVLEHARVPLDYRDLSDLADDAREEAVRELARGEARRGFDPGTAPLVRIAVARLGADEHQVLIGMHHLITDGWSVELLLAQTAAHYRDASDSGPVLDEGPASDFGEFADWIEEHDERSAADAWRTALAGLRQGAGRPGALLRPAGRRTAEFREQRIEAEAELAAGLRDRARAGRVTVGVLIQAAWGLLLARYSGRPEAAVFALTVAGRPTELPDAGESIGPFLNNIPVAVPCPGDRPLDGWLTDLQVRQARTDPYHWCSPAQIQEWAADDAGEAPVACESLLVFQNYPGSTRPDPLGPDTRLRRHRLAGPTVRTGYPLTLTVTADEELTLRIGYDASVVAAPGVERLGRDYLAVLDALAAGAATAADLPLPDAWTAPAGWGRRARPSSAAYVPPGTPLERRVADLFAQLLDLDRVGVRDRFFQIGGNSLTAVHLTRALRRELGVELPLERIFAADTPAALAEAATAALIEQLAAADAHAVDAVDDLLRQSGTTTPPTPSDLGSPHVVVA